MYELVAEDTSPYFESSVSVFDGNTIQLTITEDGAKALYGEDATPESVKDNYKVEYLGGVNVEGDDIKETYPNDYKKYEEKIAGTHYYAITDLTTGQMICKNHAVTIDQFEITDFQATIDEYYVGFHGETREWNLVLNGKNISGQNAQAAELPLSVTFTYNVQTVTTAHSGTVPACDNSIDGNIAEDAKLKWNSNIAFNNNKISESLAYDIKCYALPKAYTAVTSSQTIYYASLLDAINNTSTTDSTIYAMQSFDYSITWNGLAEAKTGTKTVNSDYYHTIDQDCEIQSGVTLVVPYDKGNTGPATIIGSTADTVNTGFNNAYKKNEVTVSAGCTFDNNGTISIAAEITQGDSGRSYNSVVAGSYAQITLETGSKNDKGAVLTNGAKIISQRGSKINCYGFITESKYYNCDSDEVLKNATTIAPKVEMLDGSTMMAVLSVVENRGGSAFFGIYKDFQAFVFNRFFVQSVATNMIVDSDSTVYGFVKMKVSDVSPDQQLELFGSGSSGFIKLGSGTKVVFKYNSTLGQNKMDVYGSASVNPISVKLDVGIASPELSTKNVFLPLSHYWNLDFRPFKNGDSATVSAVGTQITQNIKILPGASVTVHKGVTFNAGAIAVYEDNSHIHAVANTPYPDKPAGKLIVNGTLNATKVGGYIDSTEAGGTVNISSDNRVTIVEFERVEGSSILANAYFDNTTTLTAKGLIYNGAKPTADQTFAAGRQYVSAEYGDEFAWTYDKKITVQYNSMGGSTVASQTSDTLRSNVGLTLEGNGVYLQPVPIKNHYTFGGWYLDEACTRSAIGQTVYADTVTLYAKWTAIEYKVNVVHVYPEGDPVTETAKYEWWSGNDLTLPTLTHDTYKARGWYADALYENQIYTLNESLFDPTGAVREITIYLRWVSDGYNFTFKHYNNSGGAITDAPTTLNAVDLEPSELTATVTSMSSYMTDDYKANTSNKYYFKHWVYTNGDVTLTFNDGVTYKEIVDAAVAAGISESERAFELRAVWQQKVALTVNYNCGTATGQNTVLGYTNETVWVEHGKSYTIKDVRSGDYNLENMWCFSAYSSTNCSISDLTITITSDDSVENATVNVQWAKKYAFKVQGNSATLKISYHGKDYTVSSTTVTYYVLPSASADAAEVITAKVTYSGSRNKMGGVIGFNDEVTTSNYQSFGFTSNIASIEKAIDKDGAYKFYATSGNSCVAAGTLVTLADGTLKKIEDVLPTDKLLVFDHETGKFVIGEIMLIETHDGWQYYDIINLRFSNGTTVRVIEEHGFFDLTLNKYVYITEDNYNEFIGHEFAVVNGDRFESVILEDVVITTEYTGIYNIVTKYHLNCISDGLLSISGGIEGIFNIFEYDENLKYNEEKMSEDIDKYGLFTYEDFAEYVPKEVFDMFPAHYFKISIGKGYTTYDKLIAIANEYLVKHGYYDPK